MTTLTPRELEEYRALRDTIRERGTTRVWIVLAGLVAWAGLVLATAAVLATAGRHRPAPAHSGDRVRNRVRPPHRRRADRPLHPGLSSKMVPAGNTPRWPAGKDVRRPASTRCSRTTSGSPPSSTSSRLPSQGPCRSNGSSSAPFTCCSLREWRARRQAAASGDRPGTLRQLKCRSRYASGDDLQSRASRALPRYGCASAIVRSTAFCVPCHESVVSNDSCRA